MKTMGGWIRTRPHAQAPYPAPDDLHPWEVEEERIHIELGERVAFHLSEPCESDESWWFTTVAWPYLMKLSRNS